MKLTITYDLVGTGWAKCIVGDEQSSTELSASYVSDALGNLVLAAIGAVSGFRAITFGFDEEPGEFRWVIRAVDVNEIEIRILKFNRLRGNQQDGEGHPLFTAQCRPAVFARAVYVAANTVLEKYGYEDYKEKWYQYPFPKEYFDILARFLALPHNAA